MWFELKWKWRKFDFAYTIKIFTHRWHTVHCNFLYIFRSIVAPVYVMKALNGYQVQPLKRFPRYLCCMLSITIFDHLVSIFVHSLMSVTKILWYFFFLLEKIRNLMLIFFVQFLHSSERAKTFCCQHHTKMSKNT